MFLLSTDESTVSLPRNHLTQAPSDLQRSHEQILQTLASEPPGLSDNTSCPHWFDINDSKVQPIKEKAITQQFQGKESAYMLFYRKAKLQRPSEGMGEKCSDLLVNPTDKLSVLPEVVPFEEMVLSRYPYIF